MSKISLYDKVQQALVRLSSFHGQSEIGLILGTGMQSILDNAEILDRVSYQNIPFYPLPSVVSHGAEILLLNIGGKKVTALSGRIHYYEGYSMQEVTFGIRILKCLGVEKLIMTNITGSVNPGIQVGDLVLVKDHINLQSANPLRGLKDKRLGARFPSMHNAYDSDLIQLALRIAHRLKISLYRGVYAAMDGPSLETPAEYNMIRNLGGDIIGMSTVPEVIVASQCKMKTMVLSIVSNAYQQGEPGQEETIDQILANVQVAAPKMKSIIHGIIEEI